MKPILPLFIMIDACGWEIVKNDPFLNGPAPRRKRLTSVFGYSSACVPSIVSGQWPSENRNWCYFVYDPEHSPFRALRPLRFLPKALTTRRMFRRWLSKLVRLRIGFEGYFDLYNIPFDRIHLFDFSEKKSPLRPRGMNCGPNIFDFLEHRHIPYFASNPDRSESENVAALLAEIELGQVDFAFSYWPELDGLLHRVGNQSPEIPARLRAYERQIDQVLRAAREKYREVRLYVFSDHGMANCGECFDVKSRIESLGLEMPGDYAVVYDSTMARFWFFNPRARDQVTACLQEIPQGRIVPDTELGKLGALFPDRRFGELIFLMKEGVLIVPSDMGERPIRAMHGYHPTDKHSYATLFTNQPQVPGEITDIPHIFRLMTREAELAHVANQPQISATLATSISS